MCCNNRHVGRPHNYTVLDQCDIQSYMSILNLEVIHPLPCCDQMIIKNREKHYLKHIITSITFSKRDERTVGQNESLMIKLSEYPINRGGHQPR